MSATVHICKTSTDVIDHMKECGCSVAAVWDNSSHDVYVSPALWALIQFEKLDAVQKEILSNVRK